MIKRVVLGMLVSVVVLIIGAWALSADLNREMNSEPLAERLDNLPIPAEDMVLIDTWARDGSWGIQSREPDAGRVYVTIGTVDEGCQKLDEFYEALEVLISPTVMSGDPSDWCGRSIRGPDGRVSVWVEEPKPWTPIPAQFEGITNLVTIEYRSHR